ncbi:MAG: hypothetical protein JXQ90_07180 [Cyclobacteriaceae bacterium]
MLRLVRKETIHQLLTLTIIASLAMISCKEIGAVPEFEYKFDDEVALSEVDTTSLVAGDLSVDAGSLSNQAATDLSGDITGDATQTASNTSAIDNSVSQAQQDYWNSQSTTSIVEDIESGDEDIESQVNDMITTFENDPALAEFIPEVASPDGTSGRASGRLSAANVSSPVNNIVAAVNADLDDCKQAAQDAFDVSKATLDDALEAELAKIAARYNNQLSKLQDRADVLLGDAQTRHDDRKASYLTIYDEIDAAISQALSDGVITAGQQSSLNLLNKLIYALNVSYSRTLKLDEDTLINNLLTTETTKLNTANDAMVAEANRNYNTAIAEATTKRNQRQNGCHNQGSNSGG